MGQASPNHSIPSKWAIRYPNAEELNYLLTIRAVVEGGGRSKITFGGEAVNALSIEQPFKSMDWLYKIGHPGTFANYITATNLAYLLTGEDTVGNAERDFVFTGHMAETMEKIAHEGNSHKDWPLYERNRDRMSEDTFTFSDEEAKAMQEQAMASHRKWSTLLQENIDDPQRCAGIVGLVSSADRDRVVE